MVVPVVMAVAAIASAAAGIYAAEKQGQISREEADRRRKELAQYEREVKALAPGEVAPQLSLQRYQQLKEYLPEIAQFYEQQAPELITEFGSSKEKAAQNKALSKYSQLADTGTDAISDAAQEKALYEADAAAKQRRAVLLRQMAESGLGGSGQGILAGIAGGQQDDLAQRQASLDAAAEAQKRRLGALDSMSNLASNMRTANTNVETQNRQIMNQFNQNTANARNLYNQQVAMTRNDAQKYNMDQGQRIADANVGIANTEAQDNLARKLARDEARRNWLKDIYATKFNTNSNVIQGEATAARKQQGDYAQVAGGLAQAAGNAYAYQKNEDRENQKLEIEKQKLNNPNRVG